MNPNKEYYSINQFNLERLENVEDKNLIHEFENKNMDMNLENLKEKFTLNQLR